MGRYIAEQARKILQSLDIEPTNENLCLYFMYDGNGIWWCLDELWIRAWVRCVEGFDHRLARQKRLSAAFCV